MSDYSIAELKCPELYKEKTLLIKACKEGRLDMLKHYHKKGYILKNKYKLLEIASRWGYVNIVKYLVENGITKGLKNCKAICLAIKYNHLDVIDYYMKKIVDPLFSSYNNNQFDISLRDFREKIKSHERKNIVFHEAAINPNPKIVQYLRNYGFLNIMEYVKIENFDLYNNYVRFKIATDPGIVIPYDSLLLGNYIIIKGFMVKLKLFLNGRLGRINQNRYLMAEISSIEYSENSIKVIFRVQYDPIPITKDNTFYDLFLLTKN